MRQAYWINITAQTIIFWNKVIIFNNWNSYLNQFIEIVFDIY